MHVPVDHGPAEPREFEEMPPGIRQREDHPPERRQAAAERKEILFPGELREERQRLPGRSLHLGFVIPGG